MNSRERPLGAPRKTGDKLYHVAAAVTVRSYVYGASEGTAEGSLWGEIQERLGPIDTQGSVEVSVVAAAQAVEEAR